MRPLKKLYLLVTCFVSFFLGAVANAQHWSFPGSIDRHLQADHGVSTAGLTYNQKLTLHDSMHEASRGQGTAYATSSVAVRVRSFSPLRRTFSAVRYISPVRRTANVAKAVVSIPAKVVKSSCPNCS